MNSLSCAVSPACVFVRFPPFFAIVAETPWRPAAADGGDKSYRLCFLEWRFLSRCSSTMTMLSSAAPLPVVCMSSMTPSCKRDSSPLEIVSPPWPLGTPAPEFVDGILLTELKAMFFEWPVFEVSGCDGVLLEGRFCTAPVVEFVLPP